MDQKHREKIALFKYGIIAPVLNGNTKSQMKYFREIALKKYDVPYQGEKIFKAETFKSWLKIYRKNGIEGLMPKTRKDKGTSRKIDEQLADEIKMVLSIYPNISASAAYKILVSEGKIKMDGIQEQTLRKYIKNNNLKEKVVKTPRKKYEKEHINELWIADAMHGPYINNDKKKKKVFLIAAIDDHSRIITSYGWFFNENSISLEIILKEGIGRFGLPHVLYCDNGSLFSSSHLQLACARLGIALVHSKPYDSASRGKIERFFRTVRQKFLPFLDPQKIKDLAQINDYFKDWLEKEYTNDHHHGINTSPMNRFMEDLQKISIKRATEDELDMAFQITLTRKVKNDSTVSVNSVLYECPTKYIGKKIQIRHPSDKPKELFIYEDEKPRHKLKKVDVYENANTPTFGIKFNQEESK